ncbi:hypothetical protein ACLOJK_033702 [Asimina triloba]
MQRQSLGSPVSKLQIHAVAKDEKLEKEEHRSAAPDAEEDDDDAGKKAEKHHLRSAPRAQRSIHIIPILVFFCFLVLYLVSHDPSQVGKEDIHSACSLFLISSHSHLLAFFSTDLANAGGLERHFRRKDSEQLKSIHRVFELDKSEILGNRSHRSLQEVGRGVRRSRPLNRHRKLGNF